MSNKAHCPGCDATLSSIYQAFEYGDPCPNCGLSAEAAEAVNAARARKADQGLIDRALAAEKRAGAAEKELYDLRERLAEVREAVNRDPIKPEESWQ